MDLRHITYVNWYKWNSLVGNFDLQTSIYCRYQRPDSKRMEMLRLVWLGLRNGTASQGISDWLLQLSVSNPNWYLSDIAFKLVDCFIYESMYSVLEWYY